MSGNDVGCAVGWWLIKQYKQSRHCDGKQSRPLVVTSPGAHDAVIAMFMIRAQAVVHLKSLNSKIMQFTLKSSSQYISNSKKLAKKKLSSSSNFVQLIMV